MKIALILCPLVVLLASGDRALAQAKGKPYIEPPAVFCLALSPDGKTLAIAERNLNIRLWHVADRKDLRTFPIGGTRESYINSLTFSPDGKALAISGSGRLEIWDVETGKLRRAFKNEVKTFVNRMVRGDDGVFRVVKENVVKADDVYSAKFTVDGKTLFSSGTENVIKVWDAATGKETGKLTGLAGAATHLAISTDGKVLASGTFNGEIKVWDVETQKETATLKNGRSVYGLALSADGKKLLSSSGTDAILWDVTKQLQRGAFKAAKGNVSRVGFSPDERIVVVQTIEYTAWDANTFEQLATFDQAHVFGFAITPDSRLLLTCGHKGDVRVNELLKR